MSIGNNIDICYGSADVPEPVQGVSQKDAEAVYVANMDYQAHNLMNYYGVKEVDDGTILSEFYYLAQSIFSNAKYEITNVKKDDDSESYTLELTVYPLDTLEPYNLLYRWYSSEYQ